MCLCSFSLGQQQRVISLLRITPSPTSSVSVLLSRLDISSMRENFQQSRQAQLYLFLSLVSLKFFSTMLNLTMHHASIYQYHNVNHSAINFHVRGTLRHAGLPTPSNVRVTGFTNSSVSLAWDYPPPPSLAIQSFLVASYNVKNS